MNQVSKKIVLSGHFNVGKTSLTRRFVHHKFSENYMTTIGVNIEKKLVKLDDHEINMIIWDLAGEDSIDKTQTSYLKGAHGVIYVFDLAREITYSNLDQQMALLNFYAPDAKITVVGNKIDLVSPNEARIILRGLETKCNYLSSAKTGENVEAMFLELAKEVV